MAGEPVPTSPSPRWQVRVQEADFDPGAELEDLRSRASGAIVSFVGVAREMSADFAVERITLEHYPGMTERSLERIVASALARWDLLQVRVVHRYGTLAPADRIVLVAVSSAHRDEAFDACRYLVDYLKTEAPFWKRETGACGARWVEARETDERSKRKWEST